MYYPLLVCVTCIKPDMRSFKKKKSANCFPQNNYTHTHTHTHACTHTQSHEKICANCVSFRTNTVYRSQEWNNSTKFFSSKYFNNFVSMIMKEGGLAPLTTSKLLLMKIWYQMVDCLPSLIYIMSKKWHIHTFQNIQNREHDIGHLKLLQC